MKNLRVKNTKPLAVRMNPREKRNQLYYYYIFGTTLKCLEQFFESDKRSQTLARRNKMPIIVGFCIKYRGINGLEMRISVLFNKMCAFITYLCFAVDHVYWQVHCRNR